MTTKQSKAKDIARRKQRTMTIASLLFFFGTTGFTVINLFSSAWNRPEAIATPAEDPLKQQEQGYELVLKREPKNVAALEGLVNLRLQMNDTEGAIDPLEKLVKLRPNRSDYNSLLLDVRQEANAPQ